MKKGSARSSILPSLVILAGGGSSIWLAWGQDSLPAIILGLTVATLAFLGSRAPLYSVRERNEAEARNKRAELCEEPAMEALELLDKMLTSRGNVPQEELVKRLERIRKLLVVKADAELLVAWTEFAQTTDPNRADIAGDAFIRALRKSIGHDDSTLRPGFLTEIYSPKTNTKQ